MTALAVTPILGDISVAYTEPSNYNRVTAEVRKRAKYEAGMSKREQAVEDAYDAQDIEQLKSALTEYIGRLYTTKRKSPYKQNGARFNEILCDVVIPELLRKIPWHPCDEPLTQYDPARCAKFIYLVKLISRSRHLTLVSNFWKHKTEVTDKTVQMSEHDSGALRVTPEENYISDDGHAYIEAFLKTLPAAQRSFMDECLANGGVDVKDRYKLLRIQTKAKIWGAQREAIQERSTTACKCPRCSKWLRTCPALMAMVEQHGRLRSALALFKLMPARKPRPDGWWFERTLKQDYADPMATDGKSWTKPRDVDSWKPIPAKLFKQLEGLYT